MDAPIVAAWIGGVLLRPLVLRPLVSLTGADASVGSRFACARRKR